MAVGFRAASANWENGATGLTADEVVAVPAAQLTGDMMVLLASWKDFAITAQVSGWTEITEFADGTVGTGNGQGSMKVGAWYKVATSDAESDPTLDFSTTTGLLGEACILVFTKAGTTWLTPTFVTAGWSGGSSALTVSASSTITVPSGAAVVGLVGVRDDSATFTRGNTALDDSAGAVTWNGNYVEQPATHASTTTGNDMAADSGYRLVTTGAAGVTLRQTFTLSASETGSAMWIILAEFVSDPKTAVPTAASLTLTGATPTVTASDHKVSLPTAASLTATGATPTVTKTENVTAVPTAASLTVTAATPVVGVTDNQVSLPTAASLELTGATPAVVTPVVSQPTAGALVLTGAVPAVDVTTGAPVTAIPTPASLTLTGATPVVTAPAVSQPSAAALLLTGAVPAVVRPVASQPTAGALALTGATPIVAVRDNQIAVPTAASLALTGATPAVATTANILAIPTAATLVLRGRRPTVAVSGGTQPVPYRPPIPLRIATYVVPSPASLHLRGAVPDVTLIDDGDFLRLVELLV